MIEIKTIKDSNYLRLICDDDITFNFIYNKFKIKDKNYYWKIKNKKGNKNWDGFIRFIDKQGYFLKGLLIEIVKLCKKNNWNVKFDKNIVISKLKFTDKEIEKSLKVKLFPDQIEVIKKMLLYNYGICQYPTATGKSYIEIAILNLLRLKGIKDMIIIVPRETLVNQIYEDMINQSNYIKKEEIGRLDGNHKSFNLPIVIATWQSLNSMLQIDKTYSGRFSVMIQDECHVSSEDAVVTRSIINSFKPLIKYGFSATIIKNDKMEYYNTQSLFGSIIISKTINEMQKLDRISEASIYIKILNYPIVQEITSYHQYEEFIRYNLQRRKYIFNLIKEERKKNPDSNGLILIRNVDIAKEFKDLLESEFGDNVHLIHGSIKIDERNDIKEEIKQNKSQILIATSGTFSLGENVPNLNYLVIIQARKSEIEIIQQIGRLLRKSEGKNEATIYDITDDLVVTKEIEKDDGKIIKIKKRFGKKHLKERIKTFERYGLKVKNIEKVIIKE